MRIILVSSILLIILLIVNLSYHGFVTLIGQSFFKEKADGSLIRLEDKIIGSSLLAQSFTEDKYLWGRPSFSNYNQLKNPHSGYSSVSLKLKNSIQTKQAQGAKNERLFYSKSGLDPHLSYSSALGQVPRIAKARKIEAEIINELFDSMKFYNLLSATELLNVLEVNLALDQLGEIE